MWHSYQTFIFSILSIAYICCIPGFFHSCRLVANAGFEIFLYLKFTQYPDKSVKQVNVWLFRSYNLFIIRALLLKVLPLFSPQWSVMIIHHNLWKRPKSVELVSNHSGTVVKLSLCPMFSSYHVSKLMIYNHDESIRTWQIWYWLKKSIVPVWNEKIEKKYTY